ncbi:DUF1830 domain-containing protein [Coleofasciculus sp. LEGE 07081]|nr:DUF1830 domain-containing protein [Coleofasciculus sp. LEGE 07081]
MSEQDRSSRLVKGDRQMLCCYTNTSRQIQIIRFKTSSDSKKQHVIFPGQRLLFEALADADLAIQLSETVTDFIPCQQFCVKEPSTAPQVSPLNLVS